MQGNAKIFTDELDEEERLLIEYERESGRYPRQPKQEDEE